MIHTLEFYIDGEWCAPLGTQRLDVVNPADEQPFIQIALGNAEDVDRAVQAARRAFPAYAATSREERIELLQRIVTIFKARKEDMAEAIMREMGAPSGLARKAQVPSGIAHFSRALDVLRDYPFDELVNRTLVTREPIGVCALITPWNWPMNQIACKVAPALAAGCTVILKPSEVAPLSALLLAEILHEAGVPRGVFNLINGDGPTVGSALVSHPEVDMVSFTGSTRAGVSIARAAAETVKRVSQELGGKSPYIVLDDADLESAVKHAVQRCFENSGQSCNAPTRLLVPLGERPRAIEVARRVASSIVVGDPAAEGTNLGPVASRAQFDKVQQFIETGLAEGAQLVAGGPGRPAPLSKGYYVRPTVFAHVTNDMSIAREEIFGPVLSILTYSSDEKAIAIANNSPYGLAAYVASGDTERARRMARRLRTGMVHINGAPLDNAAPFGGYKQSGNGREWGRFGFEDFLETKAIFDAWGPDRPSRER